MTLTDETVVEKSFFTEFKSVELPFKMKFMSL